MVRKKINCPICGKALNDESKVDMNHLGWVCSHDEFDVKIYLEFKR